MQLDSRFLTRMGQAKILISSHFVHTGGHEDIWTIMDMLQSLIILISSPSDCLMLVIMRVRAEIRQELCTYVT